MTQRQGAPEAPDDADIVREILRKVAAAAPGCEPEVIKQIEGEVRESFGGRRWFVAKGKQTRLSAEQRRQFQVDAASSMSDQELQGKHGVSRATLYRLMKRRAP